MQIINTYPNASDLRYFQEIALTQNLSRAAERLGVGQPSLSLSVKRLESQLNVKLFRRLNRGLVLTEAGSTLLRKCNQILSNWDAVISEVNRSHAEPSGTFKLGCHPSVGLYSLHLSIPEILSSYPKIEFQFKHDLSRVITEQVISGNIDFGIVVNPSPHPDLVIREMAKDDVTFWQCPCPTKGVLICNPDVMQTQALLKKLKRKIFSRVLTSNSFEVIASLGSAGAGQVILPTRVKNAIAPALKLVKEAPTVQDTIAVIYRHDIPKTTGTQIVIEKLQKINI